MQIVVTVRGGFPSITDYKNVPLSERNHLMSKRNAEWFPKNPSS